MKIEWMLVISILIVIIFSLVCPDHEKLGFSGCTKTVQVSK